MKVKRRQWKMNLIDELSRLTTAEPIPLPLEQVHTLLWFTYTLLQLYIQIYSLKTYSVSHRVMGTELILALILSGFQSSWPERAGVQTSAGPRPVWPLAGTLHTAPLTGWPAEGGQGSWKPVVQWRDRCKCCYSISLHRPWVRKQNRHGAPGWSLTD